MCATFFRLQILNFPLHYANMPLGFGTNIALDKFFDTLSQHLWLAGRSNILFKTKRNPISQTAVSLLYPEDRDEFSPLVSINARWLSGTHRRYLICIS